MAPGIEKASCCSVLYREWSFLELGGLGTFWAPLAAGIGKASCCSILYKKWSFVGLGGLGAFWAPLAPGIRKASCCSVLYKQWCFLGLGGLGPFGRPRPLELEMPSAVQYCSFPWEKPKIDKKYQKDSRFLGLSDKALAFHRKRDQKPKKHRG